MAKNIVQLEAHRVTITAGGTIASGDFVVAGAMKGVAIGAAVSGEQVAIQVQGIVRLPKPTGVGTDMAVGDFVWWDAVEGEITETPSGPPIGYITAAATTAATHCHVYLLPPAAVTALTS